MVVHWPLPLAPRLYTGLPSKVFEPYLGLPSEYLTGLTCTSLKKVDFCRAEIAGIYFDATLPVDPGEAGREIQKLAHRVTFTRCDDVVTGRVLLQHQPHRPDVVGRMTPIAPGIKISKIELFLQTELDAPSARVILRVTNVSPCRGDS